MSNQSVAIIAGIVLLVVCAVLLFVRRSRQEKLQEIASTERSTVGRLAETAKYVAERMGEAGSFNQVVALTGLVRSEKPLTSEIAREPCVYYSMSVWREYEETYWETDSQSKQQVRKTRQGSDLVSSNSQMLPFSLEDETGRIQVNPNDAEIEAAKVVDRFEPGEAMIALGALQIDLGGMLSIPAGADGQRTLGYKFQESIIPLDRQVYVLGEAVDSGGKLAMQRPREKGRKFIISLKSQQELIRSTGSAIRWLLAGAAGSGALGAALVVAGLLGKV